MLKNKTFVELDPLTPRELARVERCLEDHRLILRATHSAMRNATYAIRSLTSRPVSSRPTTPEADDTLDRRALQNEIADAVATMLQVCQGRPDIEWTVANLCWKSRIPGSGASLLPREELVTWAHNSGSPHVQRWIEQAFDSPPPQQLPGETFSELEAKIAEWNRLGIGLPFDRK